MKDFVPYEPALALKELGFDEPCFGYYNIKDNDLKLFSNEIVDASCNSDLKYDDFKHCTAPLYSQAFRWFREKHKFDLTIQHNKKYVAIVYSSVKNFSIDEYETYEIAELECLKKLIELIKN